MAGTADGDDTAAPPAVIFHAATLIDETVAAQAQAALRRRILRAFVGRGLLESCDAKDRLAYRHSGFSVDAGVCIAAHDRAGLERLLRYCARPSFAMERLRKEGNDLVYRCAKQYSEPTRDKRGAKVDEITLTPLELIDRIAALVPPAAHAPTSLLWCAGTEFAAAPCSDGAGCTGATSHYGRARACRGSTAGQRAPNHARARATQARTGALPVGSADRQNLQGVPAAVPDVRRADAPDCVHHAQRRHPANTRPYRCAV